MLGQRRHVLMARALGAGRLQVPHRGARARRHHRRQGRGEDERRRVGAHGVDDLRLARDIAAERAEPLGERALDDVDPVHDAFALADAAAARAVHADGVDLVDIGHRVVCARRARRFRRSARCRRPSNRGSRTRSALRARAARRRAARSRWATSLWRKIRFSQPERRTPSIIELWFSASDRIETIGHQDGDVEIAARLEIQPDVKTSAASLP